MAAQTSFSRSIDLVIDEASWKAQPKAFRHPFPSELKKLSSKYEVHLLLMFLRLGEMTVPNISAVSGLARIWALLRYLHVVAETPGDLLPVFRPLIS
jgi:hypothetical protein